MTNLRDIHPVYSDVRREVEFSPETLIRARLLDLTALCENLTHERLPEAVTNELVELVRETAARIVSD